MCGILVTAGDHHQLGHRAQHAEALGRRGPDSAGVALVGPAHRASYIVRVQAGDELEMTELAIEANRGAIQNFARTLNGAYDLSSSGVYVRFVLAGEVDLPALTTRD